MRADPLFLNEALSVALLSHRQGVPQTSRPLQPRPIPRDVERRVPVWLAAPQCTGSEAALAACPGTELDPNLDLVCSHLSVAWIVCHNEPASGATASARLYASPRFTVSASWRAACMR